MTVLLSRNSMVSPPEVVDPNNLQYRRLLKIEHPVMCCSKNDFKSTQQVQTHATILAVNFALFQTSYILLL